MSERSKRPAKPASAIPGEKMLTQKDIDQCFSFSDVCRLLNLCINGSNLKKARQYIEEMFFDIQHFNRGRKRKYPLISKKCPVCNNVFSTSLGAPKEKTVCSRSCANTFFRSGINNPNWKDDIYRTTCFIFHKKECVICGESNVVEVHHYDENKNNNNPSNLVPLCPTHHRYWHSKYKELIEETVQSYVLNYSSS